MNTNRQQIRSQLFLVRLWAEESRDVGTDNEDGTNGEIEWCGKLQHVVSGASSYFDELSSLQAALEEMMAQASGSLGPDVESDDILPMAAISMWVAASLLPAA